MKFYKILLVVCLFSLQSYGQKKKDLFLLIEDTIYQSSDTGGSHKLVYNVKSDDPRFQRDVYYFEVIVDGFYPVSLEHEGKVVDLKDINYQKSSIFFKNKSACEIHEELSLNYIYLIKEIEKDKTDSEAKFMMWRALYSGTQKNIVYTDLRKINIKN